ncbi:MAG TPA: hypothetical protein VGY97_02160 [Solirubrobacteraceae bacterium]|jgi:hypothetical protein|nr:hypothetical protein [Solirubrobacteraceae bacterium]
MLLLIATVIGLAAWIVLWALGAKGFDAFMITATVVIIGATVRMVIPFLPGGSRE